MRKAFGKLRTFVERADEADRLDELHLLPLALELFDKREFPVDMEYVSQKKHPRNKLGMVARRQRYCSGTAPQMLRGRMVTCRQYAAVTKRKERAVDNPIIDLYTRRCNSIRSMKSAGKISIALAQSALKLAKEYKY